MKLKFLSVSLVLLILLAHFSTIAQSEQVDYTCTANPLIVQALSRTSQADYTAWIERLSGEVPVWVSNRQVSLDTRYTPAMFLTLANNARAFEFVEQQARSLMLHSQVAQHLFTMYAPAVFTAKNLVVDLPGATNPNEVVVLSAHLDSISTSSYSEAPGADDNATGSAALLEAVRLLRNLRFNRTIRFIWFTGEEQGLKGSYAYVNDPAVDLSQIVGVINLDMFGYDGDGDRCFELHVGTLPASVTVGQCFARVIAENALDLTHDFIEQGAIVASDHAPFWSKGVGAVEVLENYQANDLPGGCASTDINPNYHRVTDTLANMHPNYAFTIAKAAIAAAAGLAGPLDVCLDGASPLFTDAIASTGSIALSWQGVANAAGYRVIRSTEGCGGIIDKTADTTTTGWVDYEVADGRTYYYQVEAFNTEGCFSLTNGCAVVQAQALSTHFPLISK